MPIYEYICQSCEARFEKLVRRFSEEVACPTCASAAVDKQLSVFAVAGSKATPSFADCGAEACGEGACASGPCGGGGCRLPS